MKIQLLLPGFFENYTEEWYEIIFRMSFRSKSGRIIRSRTGKPFPIKIRHYR